MLENMGFVPSTDYKQAYAAQREEAARKAEQLNLSLGARTIVNLTGSRSAEPTTATSLFNSRTAKTEQEENAFLGITQEEAEQFSATVSAESRFGIDLSSLSSSTISSPTTIKILHPKPEAADEDKPYAFIPRRSLAHPNETLQFIEATPNNFVKVGREKFPDEAFVEGAKLGEGMYAEVQEMIKQGTSFAFKFAKKADQIADVMKDYTKLKNISMEGEEILGIKSQPLFKATMGDRVGYMDLKYDSKDLSELLQELQSSGKVMDLKDAFFMMNALLNAGAYMNVRGIFDNDRKEANVLLMQKEGVHFPYFSDFAGSGFKEDISSDLRAFTDPMVAIRGRSCFDDVKETSEAIKNSDVNKYVDIQNKRLTFALGCILYSVLTSGQEPLPLDFGYIDPKGTYTPISNYRPDIKPEIEDLIKSMLNPDYLQRPDPLTIKETFDSLIETLYPEINIEIQSILQKAGYVSPFYAQ